MQIVLVILEDRDRRIALQLRSNISDIANPGKWGLFGGHVEPGETPVAAAVREVQEELTCELAAEKMKFLRSFERAGFGDYSIFHYPLDRELDHAKLAEGERYGLFGRGEIETGHIEGVEIVAHHLGAIRDYRNAV